MMTEEEKEGVAEVLFDAIRNDLYKRFQPFEKKPKRLECSNDISHACKETYGKFKKGERFNEWIQNYIAYLHEDFTSNMILYREWKRGDDRKQDKTISRITSGWRND